MQEGREIKPACFPRQSLEETLGTRVRLLTPVSTSTNRPRWRSGSLSRMCQHRQQWLVLSPITTYSAIVTQECLYCTTLSATVMQEHLKKTTQNNNQKTDYDLLSNSHAGPYLHWLRLSQQKSCKNITDYNLLSNSHASTWLHRLWPTHLKSRKSIHSLIMAYSAIFMQVYDFTDYDLLS